MQYLCIPVRLFSIAVIAAMSLAACDSVGPITDALGANGLAARGNSCSGPDTLALAEVAVMTQNLRRSRPRS